MAHGHNAEEKLNILYEDSLKDMRDLTTRMEAVATTLVTVANSINNRTSVLGDKNEKLLMSQVTEITAAVHGLKQMDDGISAAVSSRVNKLLSPVIVQMRIQVEALSEKDRDAASYFVRANETQVAIGKAQEDTGKVQEAMVNKLTAVAVIFGALIIVAFAAGRWLH